MPSPPGITQCKRLPRARARESIVWIGLPYHLPIELSKVLVLDVGVSGDRDCDCENGSIITQHNMTGVLTTPGRIVGGR